MIFFILECVNIDKILILQSFHKFLWNICHIDKSTLQKNDEKLYFLFFYKNEHQN